MAETLAGFVERVVEVQDLDALVHRLAFESKGNQSKALWRLLQSIMEGARAHWIELASSRLHSTRQTYIQGIQHVTGDRKNMIVRVELLGVLPNLIERGMKPTDLHDVFFRGGKGRRTKAGFARAIPFRHMTPTSFPSAAGIPMGAAYSGHSLVSDSLKLGKEIHKAAKRLSPSTSMPGGKMKWGDHLEAGLAPHLKAFPLHLTDIYAKMYRVQKTYKKSTQNQYVTFRTIAIHTDGSPNPPGTWLHPGIEPPRNIAEDVADFVEKTAKQALMSYLGSL